MYVSNKIKKYVVDNVSDLPSAGNKHISNMCVNCECSYHVLREMDVRILMVQTILCVMRLLDWAKFIMK